jgi:hypothetical protein
MTQARELGKLALYPWYKGCLRMSNVEVSVTREERLFTKNTGHRRAERLSMMADACSLPVSESGFQPEKGLVKSGGNSDPLKVA